MNLSSDQSDPQRVDLADPDAEMDVELARALLERRMLGASTLDVRIGRYVVRERLGAGAMGVVYAAHDDRLDRMVAVKVVRSSLDTEQLRARLLREGQAMAQLSHPNVAAVYEIGVDRERSFIAMELVTGCTLRQWQRESARSRQEIVASYLQVGRGLAAAHDAGLVHRDFKPDNALAGVDGRIRVVDFGLARSEEHARSEVPSDTSGSVGSTLAITLTRSGTRIGTPAYMAPEQLRGEPAGPAADQFAFCVALYEALHGARPFAADSIQSLLEAISRGRVDRSRQSDVPRQLFAAIRRGLSVEPAARWPTMGALLAELDLEQIRKQRRRTKSVAAVALVSIGLLGYVGSSLWSEHAATCSGAAERLAGVWDRARAQDVREVLVASQADFVESSRQRIEPALGAYADDWVLVRTEACEATRIRGERPEAGLDATIACLDDGRDRLRAIVDRLQTGDLEFVARVDEAVDELPSPERCLDDTALAARMNRPSEPALARQIDEMYAQLADIDMALLAGEYEEGDSSARAVFESAVAIRHEPLQAEALLRLGTAQQKQFRESEATETLLAAARGAEACNHDRLVATAWLAVGGSVRWADVHGWLGHATAAVERLGSPPEVRLDLMVARATGLAMSGDLSRAITEFEAAITLAEELHGHESRDAIGITHNLALTHVWNGDYQSALPLLQGCVASAESSFGPRHPETARFLNMLGEVVDTIGRHREALVYYERALAIREDVFGPKHAHVALIFNNIAIVQRGLGDANAALEAAERAVLADPKAPLYRLGLANAYAAAERDDDALREYNALIAAIDSVSPKEVVPALVNVTAILSKRGRFDDAEANLTRALELATDPMDKVLVKMHLADVARARGRSELEMQHLRAALVLVGAGQLEPSELSALHMRVAVALIESGAEHREALEHADRAREALAGVDGQAERLAEIDAFLGKHGGDERRGSVAPR